MYGIFMISASLPASSWLILYMQPTMPDRLAIYFCAPTFIIYLKVGAHHTQTSIFK